MRYLSVCSGIEAASVAWHHLGWTPVGFSEIEPFPAAVLAHRFPNIPNYGDMTKHESWPITRGAIDLLVGGTPCQSFSVAGLRQGLADPRGNLMLTYLAIADRLRPRWLVWENVPGVLSSNGGRDFGTFLGSLGELGYGWAYRVLDAQYVRVGRWPRAVPQRRRRVFVVGCLGDWAAPGEVLALAEGLQRHLEARRAKGKGTPADAEGGVGAGCWWDEGQVSETLNQSKCGGGGVSLMPDKGNFGAVLQPTAYRWQNDRDGLQQDDAVAALRASQGASGFHEMNHPVIAQPVPFRDVSPTLTSRMQGSSGWAPVNEDAHLVGQPVPYDLFQITAPVNRQNREPGDPCHTLARDNAAHAAVAFQQNQLGEVRCNTVAGTVNTNSNPSGRNTPMVAIGTDCYNGAITGDVAATMGTPGSSVNASGPTVMQAVAFNPTQDPISSTDGSTHCMGTRSSRGDATIAVAHAFYSTDGTHGVNQHPEVSPAVKVGSGLGIPSPPAVAFQQNTRDEVRLINGDGQIVGALAAEAGMKQQNYLAQSATTPAVAFKTGNSAKARSNAESSEVTPTLGSDAGGNTIPAVAVAPSLTATNDPSRSPQSSEVTQQVAAVHASTMTVRRLTPRECERLQGFPDDWTMIPYRGKPAEDCPDGPRYKALGNSMACNCMSWIGERIAAYEAQNGST